MPLGEIDEHSCEVGAHPSIRIGVVAEELLLPYGEGSRHTLPQRILGQARMTNTLKREKALDYQLLPVAAKPLLRPHRRFKRTTATNCEVGPPALDIVARDHFPLHTASISHTRNTLVASPASDLMSAAVSEARYARHRGEVVRSRERADQLERFCRIKGPAETT